MQISREVEPLCKRFFKKKKEAGNSPQPFFFFFRFHHFFVIACSLPSADPLSQSNVPSFF
jgi:hypothetical protein